MAHFIFSAFSDESGESTVKGQIAACKENGISEMELRGFGKELNINNMTVPRLARLTAKSISRTILNRILKHLRIRLKLQKSLKLNISEFSASSLTKRTAMMIIRKKCSAELRQWLTMQTKTA